MGRVLELGCGGNPQVKEGDVVRLDVKKFPCVDVVWDLEKFPYPFKDNEFDEVVAPNVLEHLNNLEGAMKELHRITKNGGEIKIIVPYFASPGAFQDPTHKRVFTFYTFDYWDANNRLNYEVSDVKFKIVKKSLKFGRVMRFLVLPILLARLVPGVYEFYLSRVFPAYELHVELKAVK